MLARMCQHKLKMHKKAFGSRALPGPTGDLKALPQTTDLNLMGPTFKGRRKGKGRREGTTGEGKWRG